MPRLSVVVSLHNEAGCVEELHRRLAAAVGPVEPDWEILFVDDGSSDATWETVCQLAREDVRVRGLRLSRNFGQHYGITAGLDHCDGDWVVVMDGDLQDQPEEIPRLLARARDGFDVVLARRGHRRHGPLKRLGSWLFYRLFNYLTGMEYDSRVGNFRILSRRVVAGAREMREQLRFLGGMVAWLGFPTTSVEVVHGERFAGRGAYNWRRLWRLAQDIVVAYSDKPLRLAVRLGFVISLLALAYGLYIVVRSLAHRVPVPGWSSLIASIYFLSGIIILLLGVVGVYLGRTFAEAKRRPLYIVSDRAGWPDQRQP